MRRRASSSSNSAALADCANAAKVSTAMIARGARGALTSFAGVEHVVAAVLGPARLVVALRLRLFLAEADRLDLLLLRAEQRHHALHGLGALLAERDVVFARAALVG